MAEPQQNNHMIINLQTLTKWQVIGAGAVCLTLFVLSIIIGLLGPEPLIVTTVPPTDSLQNPGNPSPDYFVESYGHDLLDQDLLLFSTIYNKQSADDELIELKFHIDVHFQAANPTKDQNCSTAEYKILSEHEHKRMLTCRPNKEYCDNFTIIHEPFLHYECYRVNLSFPHLNTSEHAFVGDTFLNWVYFNEEFTLFEIWWRFTFVLISLIVLVGYVYLLRKFEMSEWTSEQKWIMYLLIALVFFNNPFFPLTFMVDSWFPHFLDTLFLMTFPCLILLFWIVSIDGLRYPAYFKMSTLNSVNEAPAGGFADIPSDQPEEQLISGSSRSDSVQQPAEHSVSVNREFKKLTFYGPKILLVMGIWLWGVVAFTIERHEQLDDPSYESRFDQPGYQVSIVFIFILLLFYLFYLIYVVIRAFDETRSFSGAQQRFRYIFYMGIFFNFLLVFFLLFSAFSPSRLNTTADGFLITWTIWNLYVYFAAFFFAPSKAAVSNSASGGNSFVDSGSNDEFPVSDPTLSEDSVMVDDPVDTELS